MDAGLIRAKEAAGGNSGLSQLFGGRPTPQAISQWQRVPSGRVIEVERLTGVPRQVLRPDLYPPIASPDGDASNEPAEARS